MAFEYKLKWHIMVGRVIFGILCCYLGYEIFMGGYEFWQPFLHGARKVAFGAKSKNRITNDLTFNDVFRIGIQVAGFMFCLGGLLIAMGKNKAGAFFVAIPLLVMIATIDNPIVRNESGANYKKKSFPWSSLLRHVSVLGGVILIWMEHDSVTYDEED